MKNQKGFIQIPILIVVIASVLIFGGGGYLGISRYQKYQTEKIEQERIAQEKEKETQASAERQQKALEQTQSEIEKLKSKNQEDNQKIRDLEQKQKEEELNKAVENYQPLTSTTEFFADHIVKIICSDGSLQVSGSGTVFGTNKFIITNSHVVDGMVLCSVGITDDFKKPPTRWFEATIASNIPSLDIATLKPTSPLPDDVIKVTSTFICSSGDIKLGDEVVVVGYPAVGGNTVTVTEGIVSGFDGFLVKTSAKIEFGNSGGGAFLRKPKTPTKGIISCWFGIPTSVTKGELESLGSITNYSLIHEQANQ